MDGPLFTYVDLRIPLTLPHKMESQFEKKYHFKCCHDEWTLPQPSDMFKDEIWAIPYLMELKEKLNQVKSKLNDFPLEKWHKHTTAMNPAGGILWKLREEVDPELLTQAWCKFFETVSSFHLIPSQSIEAKELNTIHLCEAPGAFIAALNHYLVSNLPQIKWNWMATTLNPHFEGNDPAKTIFDDRFIIPTEKHWTYGADHTGDIQLEANMYHLLNEARQRDLSGKGTLMLVTADGSIDCQFNPGEQEKLVSTLHLCEATTALLLLDKGGNLLLKAFTVFEAENVCLLYLLAIAFESLIAWKPATSRGGNSEMYLVCLKYRGQSELSPWLDVLSKYYGNRFSTPMFSLDSIPKTFLDQVVECAEKFMNYQVNVIEKNIETFDCCDKEPRRKGRVSTVYHWTNKTKNAVTKEFFSRYEPKYIPNDAKLMAGCPPLKPMNTIRQLHSLYDSSGQYSFNQKIRHRQLKSSSLEMLQTLHRGLEESDDVLKEYRPFVHEEMKLSPIYGGRPCKVTHLKSDLTQQYVKIGSPVKKVLISKFCHFWLLHLCEQILLLRNYLEESTTSRTLQGETTQTVSRSSGEVDELLGSEKLFPDGLQEKCYESGRKRCSLGDYNPGLAISTESSQKVVDHKCWASEGNPSDLAAQDSFVLEEEVSILKILTHVTTSCFAWHDKMTSGYFGSGIKELLVTLEGVEENGNLMILKAFPVLTRVEVGIIYLLSQLFLKLWFIWHVDEENPGDEGHYFILLYGRHCYGENETKVLNFLKELHDLAVNEEKKTEPQTLLAVVPILLLCEQDFYECIVRMNHLILYNIARKMLGECSKRITECHSHQ